MLTLPLHSCCLTWQSWLSPSTSGYSRPAWGKVMRRLPDNKTNSDERWTPQQKRRRSGGNQSVERPRKCRLVGILPFPRQNTIKRLKTLQKQSNQHAPRPRQTFSHLMVVKGLWLVYYLNEQDFPPRNLRAGFSSEQISLITSFNSVRCKKKKAGKRWGGCGKRPCSLTDSDHEGPCVNFSVVHLLKQCHPAISFVYLPNRTQGFCWLRTTEVHLKELCYKINCLRLR